MVAGYWGYPNGRIPYEAMKDITGNGDWAHRTAANAFIAMNNALYRETGRRLGIEEAYRSYETQAWYAGPNSPLPSHVARARPGESNHGWGLAFDLTGYDAVWSWLQNNAARFGFDWTTGRLSKERWHWEYVGRLDDSQWASDDVSIIEEEPKYPNKKLLILLEDF